MEPTQQQVLQVDHIGKTYLGRGWLWNSKPGVTALADVSFTLMAGEIMGIVGESGCGKSTLARIILGLEDASGGKLSLEDRCLIDTDRGISVSASKRGIQMVFQDPYSSLNPRMTVAQVVGEGLQIAGNVGKREIAERIVEMLRLVGLPPDASCRYPFQFSGGQRQRIGIARALITNPKILIADEAVSALDVSVQMQILNLLLGIRERLGIALMFISHDIGVIEYLCDRVVVLSGGRIVETGRTSDVVENPAHAYTRRLIDAVPRIK